jgi:hypothetical protein
MKTYLTSSAVVFWATAVLFTSCFSFPAEQSRSRQRDIPWTFLEPADVVGKKLAGTDEDGDYSFLLNTDGTLEYTINGIANIGTWSFDASVTMYRYTFEWTENGTEQGYIMEILQDGPEITIAGHWFLTDAYITFRKDVKFEE